MLDEQEEFDRVVNKNNPLLEKEVTSLNELKQFARLTEWPPSVYRYEMYIYSEVFKTTIKFSALLETETIPEEEYLSVLNQFLTFESEPLVSLIKNDLWKFCENVFSYMKCDENTEAKSNYEFLDMRTQDEAYSKAKILEVIADLEDDSFEIKFFIDLKWEDTYVFSNHIENGKIRINS